MAHQKLNDPIDAFGRQRRTSYSGSPVSRMPAPLPVFGYRFRSNGSDAIVRAFNQTHDQTADSVSADPGVTVWPLEAVAALTGGFALPPAGQKLRDPKRID